MADLRTMSGLLPAAVLLFTAAAFALPGEAAYGMVFYLTVLPLAAWRSRPRHLPRTGIDAGLGLALALIAWSGLTLLWGEDTGHRRFGFALATLSTAAFVIALRDTFEAPSLRRRWAAVLVWAGTANAAWSLLVGLPGLIAGQRILGWGVTRQPILGGAVMSLACLTALARAAEPGRTRRSRNLYLAACLVMAMFVLAMQSRGALLALTGGLVWLLAASPWRKRVGVALLAAICACLLLPASLRRQAASLLLDRGSSHRFEIWRVTTRLILQKPAFGHGLAANVPPSPTGFPHSLVLSLLFYSGAVGLILFAALAWRALRRLTASSPTPERAWIAALCLSGMLAGLTDLGQITKGPGPLWFIVWAPLLLALTHIQKASNGDFC